MFDHEKTRGRPYCPIMKEFCMNGWTKGMGENSDGERNKCAAWRPLPLLDQKSQEIKTVHACSVYEWPPFLSFELSGLMSQTRASTDKTATEVAKFHATKLATLDLDQQKQLLAADPRRQFLPKAPGGVKHIESKNGNQNEEQHHER